MTLSAQEEAAWRQALLLELAKAARRQARPHMPSKTLRRDTVVSYGVNKGGDSSAGYVVVPYFWALYVHDGRGGYKPHGRFRHGRRQPSVLVWFANPRDDPRTAGGTRYPRREKDIVQLTRAQYIAGLKENRRRRISGGAPYMIVTKAVLRSSPAHPFFTEGMRSFPSKAAGIVERRWAGLVKSQLIGDRDTAKARL